MTRSLLALCLLAAAAAGAMASLDAPVRNQTVLDPSVFPDAGARPQLWAFRKMEDCVSWQCKAGPGNSIILTVVHNNIKNVTPDMLTWLFMQGLRQQSVHPSDGKTYPNFLLMHPRDHVQHTVTNKAAKGALLAPKDETKWVEFPLTGCSEQAGNEKAPYACPGAPNANPGITKANATSDWATGEQVNATSYVLAYLKPNPKYLATPDTQKSKTAGKITFQVKGCKKDAKTGKDKCYPKIIQTVHSWSNKATGAVNTISLTTVQTIGIPLTAPPAVSANVDIVDNWRNGQDAMKKCQRTALHLIEEYGALEFWLQGAFNQRNN